MSLCPVVAYILKILLSAINKKKRFYSNKNDENLSVVNMFDYINWYGNFISLSIRENDRAKLSQ